MIHYRGTEGTEKDTEKKMDGFGGWVRLLGICAIWAGFCESSEVSERVGVGVDWRWGEMFLWPYSHFGGSR